MAQPFDSVLVVSFGGPEGPGDVVPFLENVLRGRNVPRERMLEVAEHYEHFGGVSPLNAQNRRLDRGPRQAAGDQRPAVARLLGQPQLASAVAGHARRRWPAMASAAPGLLHVGV